MSCVSEAGRYGGEGGVQRVGELSDAVCRIGIDSAHGGDDGMVGVAPLIRLALLLHCLRPVIAYQCCRPIASSSHPACSDTCRPLPSLQSVELSRLCQCRHHDNAAVEHFLLLPHFHKQRRLLSG